METDFPIIFLWCFHVCRYFFFFKKIVLNLAGVLFIVGTLERSNETLSIILTKFLVSILLYLGRHETHFFMIGTEKNKMYVTFIF